MSVTAQRSTGTMGRHGVARRALHATVLSAMVTGVAGCTSEAASQCSVKLNQLGFVPAGQKLAVVPDPGAERFEVRFAVGGGVAFSGRLSESSRWPFSDETVRIADFSELDLPGAYVVVVPGAGESPPFRIRTDVHRPLVRAALKAFYLARSGIDLEPEYAGEWARQGGHPDDAVLVHMSAASESRPAGSSIASPGGWYDAGDYNKYTVNAAFATAVLLAASEHYPEYFDRIESGIPESGDEVPDIIDEAVFNLRWMLTMQDPADGGVYHKLTTLSFAGMVMPAAATADRFVVQKSTPAALDLAATAAMAARVLDRWPQLESLATRCLEVAEKAWRWAEANPFVAYEQPADVHTGTYASAGDDFADERAWAAVELFITTGSDAFLEGVDLEDMAAGVPSWPWMSPFAWMSLAHHEALPPGLTRDRVEAAILDSAAPLLGQAEESAYRVALGASPRRVAAHHPKQDFAWGSNGVAASQAMVLLWAHRLSGDRSYLDAAVSNLDYILGRNATGYCFVTGLGARSPRHPHHRPAEADGVADPLPGFVVGGPNGDRQDSPACVAMYQSELPALAYVDHVCSYATNEVAINWNAALVYVAGGIDALTGAEPVRRATGRVP